MRTAFGAVAGALAVGAVLVSYNLGARHAFSGQMTAPTTQMVVGPDGIARPYLVQAGQTGVRPGDAGSAVRLVAVQHDDSGSCRSAGIRGVSGVSAAGAVSGADAVRHRAGGCAGAGRGACRRSGVELKCKPRRIVAEERAANRRLGWRGAGLGALIGGKKGALAGAAIGGGAAAIYDR